MTGILCSFVGQKAAAIIARTAKTITANGNAQVDTAQSKFGGASAYFDGNGDYLSTPDSDDWAQDNFTTEAWIRIPNTQNGQLQTITGQWQSSYEAHLLHVNTDGKIKFWWRTSSGLYNLTGTTVLSNNTWYHVAAVFEKGVSVRIYVNGSLEATNTTGVANTLTNIGGSTNFTIGHNHNALNFPLTGWIDEVRVSKSARYSSNFTAPTAAFTNDANTLLLLHMDGADGSTTFTDDTA